MKYLSTVKSKLSEPELTIHLDFNDDGVDVIATEPDGTVWSVVGLTKDGKLKLYKHIGSSSGLQTNKDGTIKTTKE